MRRTSRGCSRPNQVLGDNSGNLGAGARDTRPAGYVVTDTGSALCFDGIEALTGSGDTIRLRVID